MYFFLSDASARNISKLDTKVARKCWEEVYCTHYIKPVLEDLNGLLSEHMRKMVNDTSLG